MSCISIFLNLLYSLFLQKHVMDVVDGVTLVASVSVKVLEDGDTYSSLLQIAHRLHGWCPCMFVSTLNSYELESMYILLVLFPQMFWCLCLCQRHLCSSASTHCVRPGGRTTWKRRKSLVALLFSSHWRRASCWKNQSVHNISYMLDLIILLLWL